MINSFNGEFRYLSNFWIIEVELDGVWYASVEHAYQAAKTVITAERVQVFLAQSPGEAKRRGKTVTKRKDWAQVKLVVMENLLRQKFAAGILKYMLDSTKPEELVEGNTWGDTFWGVCNGVGENHLGKLLMKIRDEAP